MGDCNLDFGSIAGQLVGDFQAPGIDTATACHLQDILEQFSLFAPATFNDCHQGPRHTHSSELLGSRRIDFIFLPAQWKAGVTGSWGDYDMDMLSPNDDHFMPVCDFKGRVFGPDLARGPRSRKLTRKLLRKATPRSVDAFFRKVTAIPVPQWDVPPHLHKQCVDSQIWDAAELLDVPKHVPRKIIANEKIVELSVTRMWHLKGRPRYGVFSAGLFCDVFLMLGSARSPQNCTLSILCHLASFVYGMKWFGTQISSSPFSRCKNGKYSRPRQNISSLTVCASTKIEVIFG